MNSMEQAGGYSNWEEGGWSSQQELDNIQNFEDMQEYLFGDLSDLPEQSFLADLNTSNQPVAFTMKHDTAIDLTDTENEVLDLSMKSVLYGDTHIHENMKCIVEL